MSTSHRSSILLAITSLAFVPNDTGVLPLSSALRGSVEIVSFGTVELAPDGGLPITTIHVRATYMNRGTLPWTIDVATTRVLVGESQIGPLFANSDVATLPVARVNARETRVIDLYFELPSAVADGDSLDELTVVHRVNTPDVRYEGRTLLRRMEPAVAIEPTPPPGSADRWWATPTHMWLAFWHRDGWLVPRPPKTVVITRGPHALYEAVPTSNADSWPPTYECSQW